MKKRKYSREFKLDALRQFEEWDGPVSELAEKLGLRRNQLYKWKTTYERKGENAFLPVSDKDTERSELSKDQEISRLKKALKASQQENEILKKLDTYFKNQKD